MFSKQNLFDFLAVFALTCIAFLVGISANFAELLEPWETSTVLAVQHMNQANIVESSFWVPRLEGTFVAQPYLELWTLAALLHVFPVPDPFILRLPGACAGILLTLMSFLAVKTFSTRRTAWMTAIVLLTLPMFVLTGKFIHGDIWLILAIALPNLFYLMTIHASTQRMHRTMLCLSALSLFISFISGGLFAFAILTIEIVLIAMMLWKNPRRKDALHPLTTRYFIIPLYISIVLSGCVFGIYVTKARYELENREPVTLSELNEALDEDRIISIERRQKQIIGEMRTSGNTHDAQMPFILVESSENHNTDSQEIFTLNEADVRTFENYLMWRFQKKVPAKSVHSIPEIGDAFQMAFRFFWYHTNTPYKESTLRLARAQASVISENPNYAAVIPERMIQDGAKVDAVMDYPESTLSTFDRLKPNELVRVMNNNAGSEWTEILTGKGEHGYIPSRALELGEEKHHIRWTSWLDVLLFGLMPWGCFIPIALVCIFTGPQKLSIAKYPFCGEYHFLVPEDKEIAWTPVQCVLLSWVTVSLLALFFGINHSRHDIFIGVIPVAMLFAIALTSTRFWHTLRESIEARLFLIIFAFACLSIAIVEFHQEPFRLLRYLMTDPLMHWDEESAIVFEKNLLHVIVYGTSFVILTLISFSGATDAIQKFIIEWRENHKRTSAPETKMSSSTTLMRISRGDNVPIPYAPAISLTFLALLSAHFIYFEFTPAISDSFTETSLIERYFALATQSEPVYLISGENTQLCLTYRDCEPGYVCQNSRCRITTFSSYSLNVAKPITRMKMLQSIAGEEATQPAFYIVPKDALFAINQAYRAMFSPELRRNLKVIDATSSRLYLIGNHVNVDSVSPLDKVFPANIPEGASQLSLSLNDNVTIEGFRMERLNFEREKRLELTIYYRIQDQIETNPKFWFSFEIGSRSLDFQRPLLNPRYETHRLMPGDLIANKLQFELAAMPSHGYMDVLIGISEGEKPELKHLTTIDF